ncbi:GNAT family N-acetyltransferase [Aquipseudomonas ullengensis]|uniref:GNAT family N-acetyltransferase n=1 Tax=Aquipseudomonas ullengensis TaxID=2759166 RepID=A0A7W4LQI0_9GAMM|nr:GNAT family N-acetyltransferase [Pseudomonas ullengensis]MBB2497453.1 GNAT family N-acetyltransferase [Pseudomonas ullengensis]
MPTLDWLRNHPAHTTQLAEWLYQQFPYEFSEQPLADWQAEFAAGQHNGEWEMLIALDGDNLLGSAGLACDDLPQRADLGPWLACVYVHPEARGQGLAERLIEAICSTARERGHEQLYLHTHDRADYYAKRGWTLLERFQAWGATQHLMQRPL